MLNIKLYIRIDQFFNSCTHQLLAQNQISDLYGCCNHSLLAHIHMSITDQPYREITSRAREWKFGDLTTKKWCLMLDTWWPTLARSEKRRISLEKRRICSFSLEKRRISNLMLQIRRIWWLRLYSLGRVTADWKKLEMEFTGPDGKMVVLRGMHSYPPQTVSAHRMEADLRHGEIA